MKKVLKIVIPLLLLGALAYQFRIPLRARLMPLWDDLWSSIFGKAPCEEPIPYKLGTFDTKFNISKSYFQNALADAEAIWETSFGRELFAFAPEDSSADVLKINLIYDYRQQATSKLASLGIVVQDSKSSYDALKTRFTALKAAYEKEASIFSARVETFNQQQQVYEREVNFWNKKGGAPQKEYDKVQADRLALEAEAKELQAIQARLDSSVDEINALVVALNRLVVSLNLTAEKYNAINVARGESFEEGVYSSDGVSQEIDVYEFSSRSKLARVLTHELGHALGLEHIDDPKAIMYELNQGDSEKLAATDLLALQALCGVK